MKNTTKITIILALLFCFQTKAQNFIDLSDDALYLKDDSLLNNTSNFTIEAWINITKNKKWGSLFLKSEGPTKRIGLQVGDKNNLYVLFSNGEKGFAVSKPNTIEINKWFHVAIVYNGSAATDSEKLKLYLNGKEELLKYNIPVTNTTATFNKRFLFMNKMGHLSNVRFWDSSLEKETINVWNKKYLIAEHPDFSKLVVYLPLRKNTKGALGTKVNSGSSNRKMVPFSEDSSPYEKVKPASIASPTKTSNPTNPIKKLESTEPRVVGYLPTYRFYLKNKIDYASLSHLIICFANPDPVGRVLIPNIGGIIETAKKKNPTIKILLSFGGGGVHSKRLSDRWSNLIDIPKNRAIFVNRIVDFSISSNLDGIDIDLEGDVITEGFSDFILELKEGLSPHNKILSSAFANNRQSKNITSEAINALDYINIMSYDKTGPWTPNKPGQHSSFEYAKKGIEFWGSKVNGSKDKINLGVPFYGFDFISKEKVKSITYAQMINKDVKFADVDVNEEKTGFYNGRPTIESKVELANKQAGGIVIWEIGQDSFTQYSLLKTINKKYKKLLKKK